MTFVIIICPVTMVTIANNGTGRAATKRIAALRPSGAGASVEVPVATLSVPALGPFPLGSVDAVRAARAKAAIEIR